MRISFENLIIHTLANGATVIPLLFGSQEFSDSTKCAEQNREIVEFFYGEAVVQNMGEIKGMKVTKKYRRLSVNQHIGPLHRLSQMADLIIVPESIIEALERCGHRDHFPNIVTFQYDNENWEININQLLY